MIDSTIVSSAIVATVSLVSVAAGSSITWLSQRNEWGRQRRWELKQNSILDVLRGLAGIEGALIHLNIKIDTNPDQCPSETRIQALEQFAQMCSQFRCYQTIADFAIGGELSIHMNDYIQYSARIAHMLIEKGPGILNDLETHKELARKCNAVVFSARKALGIKDAGNLSLFDGSN